MIAPAELRHAMPPARLLPQLPDAATQSPSSPVSRTEGLASLIFLFARYNALLAACCLLLVLATTVVRSRADIKSAAPASLLR